MEVVYTAIGKISLQRYYDTIYPVICCNGKENQITKKEMILWSILVNTVVTEYQLEILYKKKAHKFLISNEAFLEILQRLETRNLIVKGSGQDWKDAVYNLIKKVYITPIEVNLLFKINAFFYLLIHKKIAFWQAVKIFGKYKLTKEERYILNLVKQGFICSREIIEYTEHTLEEKSVRDTVKKEERIWESIKIILNLYEKGLINFDIKQT